MFASLLLDVSEFCRPEMEEDVLFRVEWESLTSTRTVAAAVDAAQNTIWKVLHEQLLYPSGRRCSVSIWPIILKNFCSDSCRGFAWTQIFQNLFCSPMRFCLSEKVSSTATITTDVGRWKSPTFTFCKHGKLSRAIQRDGWYSRRLSFRILYFLPTTCAKTSIWHFCRTFFRTFWRTCL